MEMVKRGAVEWTMGKLLATVLAIVLLVIIIFGWSNAVKPLYERVETRIGEILILLNLRDGGDEGPINCILKKLLVIEGGPALLDALGIEGMTRDLVIFERCRTGKCFFRDNGGLGSYLFSDGNLLKEITKDEAYESVEVSDSADMREHKRAFEVLNDSVGEFLKKKGMNYQNFIEIMKFGEGRILSWEKKGLGVYDNNGYGYNGDIWREGEIEESRFVADNEDKVNTVDVFDDIYGRYKKGKDVYWRMSEFSGDNLVAFKDWFGYAESKLSEDEDVGYYIRDYTGGDTIYRRSNGKWTGQSGRIPLVFPTESRFLEVLYGEHEGDEDDISWKASGNSEDYWIFDGGNVEHRIVPKEGLSEDQFKELFRSIQKEYDDNAENYNKLIGELSAFLQAREDVDFESEMVSVKNDVRTFDKIFTFPTINFKVSSGDRFGFFYNTGKPVLFYNNEHSPFFNSVGLSDKDWQHFLKMNDIYLYMKEHCL